MHFFKTLLVALAMVAVTQAQLDPNLLKDPIYQPFIKVVLEKASVCITDPAITTGKFVASGCPGLVKIMTDLYNNVTKPEISCQPECVATFDTLNDACSAALRSAFTTGTDAIAQAGTGFYKACDMLGTANPSSPAATPTTTSPSPSPATPSSSPKPSPTPATPASAALQSIPQAVMMFGAAIVGAVMVLA